jgi:hypothetical protein
MSCAGQKRTLFSGMILLKAVGVGGLIGCTTLRFRAMSFV